MLETLENGIKNTTNLHYEKMFFFVFLRDNVYTNFVV